MKRFDLAPFSRLAILIGISFTLAADPSLGELPSEAADCANATGIETVPLCTQDIASGRFADKALAGLLLKRAGAYAEGEKYDLAFRDLEQAIRIDPENGPAYLMRGNIYLVEENYAAALKDFNEAIRIDPNDANAFTLRANVPGSPYTPALSPQALSLIAPIHDAFAKVETAQAVLPPPKDDRERLERILDLDQAGRGEIMKMDFGTLPASEKYAAMGAAWKDINAHDQANQAAVKAMIPPEGWFLKSKYGAKAAQAAFLVVQHSDQAFMRVTLAKLEPLVAVGEADGASYALMYDRVAVLFDKRPQRYGSQVICESGKWQPYEIEDPAHVNDRRRAVGLDTTLEENMKRFSDMPCN